MVLLQGCSRGTVNLFRMVNPCPQKTFPGSLDGSCRLKPCEAATEATTRCGFPTSEITWYDAVWCGFYFFGIVRYGAVRRSAVRCGFPFFRIVRCSADAILKESYGALRCGYPLKSCFLRCGWACTVVEKRSTLCLNRSHTMQKTYRSRLPSECQRYHVYIQASHVAL